MMMCMQFPAIDVGSAADGRAASCVCTAPRMHSIRVDAAASLTEPASHAGSSGRWCSDAVLCLGSKECLPVHLAWEVNPLLLTVGQYTLGLLEEFRSFYFYNTWISSDLKFYIFIFLDFVTVSFLHKLFVIVKVKKWLFFWGQGNLIDDLMI